MKKLLWIISFIASGALYYASIKHVIGLDPTEVIGFITGGYCVWLTVVQNIWNWPIGILNAVAFAALFLHSKLYADAGLQVIYVILGFIGWYWWLRGGDHKSKLKVGHISLLEAGILTGLGILATIGFTRFLMHIGDVAPLWDGLTTISSLIAQYMLTKKYFENWAVWIATDVIYIVLYGYKHLFLTGILYFIFLVMCIVGVRKWRQTAPVEIDHNVNIEGREA